MQITPHFRLEEFTRSQTASRKRIDNDPRDSEYENIIEVLAPNMEVVRRVLDKPITITSGYRCEQLNTVIGGAKQSAHMSGLAADFVCPGFGTPLDIITTLDAAKVPFEKVIEEFGQWVHIEFPRVIPNRTILLAEKIGAVVHYTQADMEALMEEA